MQDVVHEQNAGHGRANRLLAPRADAVATSFAEVGKVRASDRGKLVLTGNPVRDAIRRVREAVAEPLGADEPIVILVTGGSRSEEHTSELQSLMRSSYAVFCLKQKTHITIHPEAQ